MTKFWITGKSADFNSGTLATVSQVNDLGSGGYYIASNWMNSGVYGGDPSTSDRAAFLYSIQNGGSGQYLILSTSFDSGYYGWNFDLITNGNGTLGANTESPLPIPALTLASQTTVGGMTTLNLTWTPIANLKGFYDVDPGTNLITGVAVRYFQGSAAPTSFKTAGWPVAGVVSFGTNGPDPGQAAVQVPETPAGMVTYVALSVLFDGGAPGGFTETAFVGAPTLVGGTAPPACTVTCSASGPSSVMLGDAAQFSSTVSATNCATGTPAFAWSFGDGSTSTDQNPYHTYAQAGSYAWSVVVTQDGESCSSSGTTTVTLPPCTVTSSASVPASAVAGTPVAFSASATASYCSGTPSYAWTFGDGGTSSIQSPSYTYASAGTYAWSVTATVGGQSSTSSGTITVTAPPPPPVSISFASITASTYKRSVTVAWTMSAEVGVTSYEVEASSSAGGPFSAVSPAINPGGGSYSYTIQNTKLTYFRVAALGSDGSTVTSSVVSTAKARTAGSRR
ncbi:MAG: PKD domain-containing protein [Acidobacteriota bacterium]